MMIRVHMNIRSTKRPSVEMAPASYGSAQIRIRNLHEVLDVESAGSQELDWQGHLETGVTKAGGVRYKGHEGSLRFTGRYTEDKSPANRRARPRLAGGVSNVSSSFLTASVMRLIWHLSPDSSSSPRRLVGRVRFKYPSSGEPSILASSVVSTFTP